MIKKFSFEPEVITGILLIVATIAALLVANSENFTIYQNFFSHIIPLKISYFGIQKDLTIHDWINDALMAIFFLLIGLELKKEILSGELSSKKKIMLPAIAACGGVIIPALIFCFFNFNHNHNENLRAFAVPTATDIAFAYGVICLFGNKISKSLKVFLISLAIFDDLIAIFIIAFFYAKDFDLIYFLLAIVVICGLVIFYLKQSKQLFFYLILGVILWLMILKSGIHPSIAGVLLAIFIPSQNNILHQLIHKISPVVNFLILPIFAFTNSGIRIENFSWDIFTDPLALGIILGLFLGKQFGVMMFSFIAVKLGIANLPRNSNWLEFYGVAILTGIGFTMSFFIGSLALFNSFDEVKIAVLFGSFLSAIYGMIVIYFFTKKE